MQWLFWASVLWGLSARTETTVSTFISTFAQPKLRSSLNLLNLLAAERNAKRDDGISE